MKPIISDMKHHDLKIYWGITNHDMLSDLYIHFCDEFNKHIYGYLLIQFRCEGIYACNDIGCDEINDITKAMDLTYTPSDNHTHRQLKITGVDDV
jgi:hypothetical protein